MGLRTYLCVAGASLLLGGAFAACNTAGSGGALPCTDGGLCPGAEAGNNGGSAGTPGTAGAGGSAGSPATGGTGGMGTGGMGTGGVGTGGSGGGGFGGSGGGGFGGSGGGGFGGSGGGGFGGSGGTGGSCTSSFTLPAGCLTNPSQFCLACNPITNAGCNTAAGEACDVNGSSGWQCFPSGNTQTLGQSCDEAAGPFCAGTMTCMPASPDAGVDAGVDAGTAGVCKHYCCSDSDCNGGTCVPFPTNIGTLGTCN